MNIKDFSHWKEYKGNSMGSGRSEKIWLTLDNEVGLFKFPKLFSDGNITTEHISEKLASDIANILDVPCAKIDIGTYNGKFGSMSYKINKDNEFLMEGISFINKSYPDYDIYKLYDPVQNIYYSLPIIYPIVKDLNCEKEFIEMMVFDALIGNSDRHHSNWAVLKTFEGYNRLLSGYSPLYDNGSSLCSYVKESDIDSFLGKDTRRMVSLVTTKSKSRIRIDSQNPKEPRHDSVLLHLFTNKEYRVHFIPFAEKLISRMTEQNIDNILNGYSDDIISCKRKELIKKFLIHKILIIYEILKGG